MGEEFADVSFPDVSLWRYRAFTILQSAIFENMTDIWNATIKPSSDALFQLLAGETVLLNIRTEQYFGLDPVGTRIWELLIDSGSASAVQEKLEQEFEVDSTTLREDMERLLGELVDAKLIEVTAASAA